MKQTTQTSDISECVPDEELIDTLLAISVVSKRLARNLSALAARSKTEEGGKTDERDNRDAAQMCCCYQRYG